MLVFFSIVTSCFFFFLNNFYLPTQRFTLCLHLPSFLYYSFITSKYCSKLDPMKNSMQNLPTVLAWPLSSSVCTTCHPWFCSHLRLENQLPWLQMTHTPHPPDGLGQGANDRDRNGSCLQAGKVISSFCSLESGHET